MVTIPRLETERLILRAFTSNDFDAYADLWADGDWSQFIGGPLDRNKAWRTLAADIGHWHLLGHGMFAVEEKATGKFVGMIGHWHPEGWPEPEIAWTLAPTSAGKGFATEAVHELIDYTFNTLKWDTVVSYIDDKNIPSQKVATRVGAIAEDTIEMNGKPIRVHRHPNPNTNSASSTVPKGSA